MTKPIKHRVHDFAKRRANRRSSSQVGQHVNDDCAFDLVFKPVEAQVYWGVVEPVQETLEGRKHYTRYGVARSAATRVNA